MKKKKEEAHTHSVRVQAGAGDIQLANIFSNIQQHPYILYIPIFYPMKTHHFPPFSQQKNTGAVNPFFLPVASSTSFSTLLSFGNGVTFPPPAKTQIQLIQFLSSRGAFFRISLSSYILYTYQKAPLEVNNVKKQSMFICRHLRAKKFHLYLQQMDTSRFILLAINQYSINST